MSEYLAQAKDIADLERLLYVKDQMGKGKYLKRLILSWEVMVVFKEPLLLSKDIRYKFYYNKEVSKMNLVVADNVSLVIKELEIEKDYVVVDPYQDIPEWKDK